MKIDANGNVFLTQKELVERFRKSGMTRDAARQEVKAALTRIFGCGRYIKFKFITAPGDITEAFYDLSRIRRRRMRIPRASLFGIGRDQLIRGA